VSNRAVGGGAPYFVDGVLPSLASVTYSANEARFGVNDDVATSSAQLTLEQYPSIEGQFSGRAFTPAFIVALRDEAGHIVSSDSTSKVTATLVGFSEYRLIGTPSALGVANWGRPHLST
jgi:hypothetical protein